MRLLFTAFVIQLLLLSCTPKEIQTGGSTTKTAPQASFNWKAVSQGQIQFTNTSTNAVSYQWQFGDGASPSNELNPVHTYLQNGQYTATLTVTNSVSIALASQGVTVGGYSAPTLDFTITELTGGQVAINNRSTNATTFSWNFGNGQTSTQQNPSPINYDENKAYVISLTGSGAGGSVTTQKTVTITTAKPKTSSSFAAAVDDQTLVTYLPGLWGAFVSGDGYKYDSYTYTFNQTNNTLIYDHGYNSYKTILSPDSRTLSYTFDITNKIISVDSPLSGKREKHARFEVLSGDEMRFFFISETSNTYTEFTPIILTKIGSTEKSMAEVVRATSLLPILQGFWIQGKYSIDDDVAFDFSSGKNYYNYESTFNLAKSITKYEYKIDGDGVLSYRIWNSKTDPGWKKYKIRVVSDKVLELYRIDISTGKTSSSIDYTLRKRL